MIDPFFIRDEYAVTYQSLLALYAGHAINQDFYIVTKKAGMFTHTQLFS